MVVDFSKTDFFFNSKKFTGMNISAFSKWKRLTDKDEMQPDKAFFLLFFFFFQENNSQVGKDESERKGDVQG